MELQTQVYILCGALVLIGIAMLLHIRKEPKDAHGCYRT